MKGIDLNNLEKNLGSEVLLARINDLLESKDGKPPELRPEDFSLKQLNEQVSSALFPKITGSLINRKVIDAYTMATTIGDQLVTVVPSKKRKETIAAFLALEGVEIVLENAPYPLGKMGEKFIDVWNVKYGKILDITEEAVMFDETGQILQRAATIAEGAAAKREQVILYAIQDKDSNIYGGSALYSSGHANLGSTAFGTDGSGMKATRKLLFNMKDEEGKPLLVPESGLLVPVDLEPNASDLIRPSIIPGTTVKAESPYFQKIVSNVFCSSYMLNATAYYYGAFKRQFWYFEVWPIQVLELRDAKSDDAAFERDVLFRYKVRHFGGCGAIDYHYVIKGNA